MFRATNVNTQQNPNLVSEIKTNLRWVRVVAVVIVKKRKKRRRNGREKRINKATN